MPENRLDLLYEINASLLDSLRYLPKENPSLCTYQEDCSDPRQHRLSIS